jgi:hypothetical protein
MSKCVIVKLLREEIGNLIILVQRLEDESKLCFPCEYNCDKCFDEVIGRLKQLKKDSRRACGNRPVNKLFEIYEGFR